MKFGKFSHYSVPIMSTSYRKRRISLSNYLVFVEIKNVKTCQSDIKSIRKQLIMGVKMMRQPIII